MADSASPQDRLRAVGLALGFGGRLVQQGLTFSVRRGSVFAIMGSSGCGKSTLLKAMIGLVQPRSGTVLMDGEDYWASPEARRMELGRHLGVLFQSGALWSSMSVAQNIALPLQLLTALDPASIDTLVRVKLALVGLGTASGMMPSELSGGMRKRAALARCLALDPDLLLLDEPTAGLDPVASRHLDDLILDLRNGLGATIVIVSHELSSLFATCDDGIFLDGDTHTAIAHGSPRRLRETCAHPVVRAFMQRAALETDAAPGSTHGAV